MATDAGNSAGGGQTDGDRDPLPDSVVEELRSHERRRAMVAELAGEDDAVPLSDLSRAVAARERDVSPADVDEETVRVVREDIYEHHLPKLTATGVVAFDSLVSTVELATADDRLLDGT